MKESAKYAKIVEWSEEHQYYVGSAPGLILGGCHGDDESQVFNELCESSKRRLRFTIKRAGHCRRQPPDGISQPKCRTSRDV